jgi:hypothetical protein
MAMWPDEDGKGAPIDAAIDEAARQMTGSAPGGDFKARVLARIGEREPVSGRWRLAWRMAPVAAAVIIFFFVFVGRSVDFGKRGGENPAIPPRPTESATRQPQPTTDVSAAQSQTRQTPTSVRRPPDPTYAKSSFGRTPGGMRTPRVAPSDVDALVPAPLNVESIRLAALPPADSIGVTPLETIEPIDVAPLVAPEIDEPQRRER